MAAFDICVLTSLWEGLPRVLVQAALVGKPIVTYDIEGASEVIKNGINGFIVPVKDVVALGDKLNYLIENPERAKYMGEMGKSIVGNSWDSKKMIHEISKLYISLTHSMN